MTISRYQVWLNGVGLHQLSPDVAVLDIVEQPPYEAIRTEGSAGRDGQRVMQRRRLSLTVSVRLVIRDRQPATRRQTLDRVRGWMAAGGTLALSTRPGKVLHVTAVQLPSISSEDHWQEALTAVFTAYEQPWWMERRPQCVALRAPQEVRWSVHGNADETPYDVHAHNATQQVCDAFSIRVGESALEFAGLALAPGETLHATHNAHGDIVLSIEAQDGTVRSVHACRTPESADDLLTPCGRPVSVTVQADAALEVSVQARGRWL